MSVSVLRILSLLNRKSQPQTVFGTFMQEFTMRWLQKEEFLSDF